MKNKYYIKQLYAKSKDLTPFAHSLGHLDASLKLPGRTDNSQGGTLTHWSYGIHGIRAVLLLTEEYKVEAFRKPQGRLKKDNGNSK